MPERPYRDAADLERLAVFLMACRAADPGGDYRHPGDLCWHFRRPVDGARDVRLWEDDAGGLLGFALAGPADGTLWVQVSPNARGSTVTERAFAWGLERHRGAARKGVGPGRVFVLAREDGIRMACLVDRGFRPSEYGFVDLWRPLDRPIPNPPLPAGYAIRPLAGDVEIGAYVAMHRDA